MAGPDSWMPVYWADLWNKTRDLNAVEQCAYYNLLGSMWSEGGSLPNDNDRLQRMSRVTEKEWRTVSATVTAYFDLGEDGRFYQKRLSEEYAKAMKAYTARSEHMRAVNSKRAQSPRTVTVDGERHVTHNSQSPIGDTPIAPKGVSYSDDFNHFWELWPHKVGKDAAWRGWQKRKDRPSIDEILAAVARYRASKPADRPWCNPATWINEGRWSDVPAEVGIPTATTETLSDAEWGEAIEYWRRTKTWPSNMAKYGPEPGMDGSKIPPHIAKKYEVHLDIPDFMKAKSVAA